MPPMLLAGLGLLAVYLYKQHQDSTHSTPPMSGLGGATHGQGPVTPTPPVAPAYPQTSADHGYPVDPKTGKESFADYNAWRHETLVATLTNWADPTWLAKQAGLTGGFSLNEQLTGMWENGTMPVYGKLTGMLHNDSDHVNDFYFDDGLKKEWAYIYPDLSLAELQVLEKTSVKGQETFINARYTKITKAILNSFYAGEHDADVQNIKNANDAAYDAGIKLLNSPAEKIKQAAATKKGETDATYYTTVVAPKAAAFEALGSAATPEDVAQAARDGVLFR